jgi:hypothetical protein
MAPGDEPNDSHYSSYLAPALAAELQNAAYAFCSGYGCTSVAGDLLDSEANMLEYERLYERHLRPGDPGNWGIHPYHAVKYMSDSTVASFRAALPSPATDRIWFTACEPALDRQWQQGECLYLRELFAA